MGVSPTELTSQRQSSHQGGLARHLDKAELRLRRINARREFQEKSTRNLGQSKPVGLDVGLPYLTRGSTHHHMQRRSADSKLAQVRRAKMARIGGDQSRLKSFLNPWVEPYLRRNATQKLQGRAVTDHNRHTTPFASLRWGSRRLGDTLAQRKWFSADVLTSVLAPARGKNARRRALRIRRWRCLPPFGGNNRGRGIVFLVLTRIVTPVWG